MPNWIDLNGALAILVWFAAAMPNLVVQLWVTFKLTADFDELKEIFEHNNIAVALAVGGQIIGLVLIMTASILFNTSIPQMLLFTWLGWLLQIATFIILEKLTPRYKVTTLLKEGQVATGLMVGIIFVALGLFVGGLFS